MKQNRYDQSFKSEAVRLALSSELTYIEVARDLGVNYKTLCSCIKQNMTHPKPLTTQNNAPTKQDYQALELQNRALQKQLDIRKKEIEFLKKASAYFASLK